MDEQTQSINIVEYEDNNDGVQKIRLSLKNLAKVLCQPGLENKQLAVVGIAGPLRTGKSFLLSYLMRYLRGNGWKNPQWLGDDEKCADDGISWRSGRRAHTKGIHIWNEIFTVERGDKKMAILLLDTQGLFDSTMTKEGNMKIFTFTVLLCSHLMLNTKSLDERELESLEFFSEYAKNADVNSAESPFQTLMFLIRDWQYSSEDAYGFVGGSSYLNDILRDTNSPQLNAVRQNLRATFQKLECFLMPHPGDCVSTEGFVGRNKDLRPEFLENVKELTNTIFETSSLQVKSHGGKAMTGRSLWSLLQACDKTFVNGKIPNVENMTMAFAKMINKTAMEESCEKFKTEFEKIQNECKKTKQDLSEFREEAMKVATDHFETETRFGSEELRREYRKQLILECQDLYKLYAQADDLRKITAHNFSSEKVHEIWSQYKDNMKQEIEGNYQSADDMDRMHRTKSNNALKAYQIETSSEIAFHEDHSQQLENIINKSFQKFKKVNEERHFLQSLGSQDEMKHIYEGYLFLHHLSQEYRQELEKFSAVFIEEERFEKQVNELNASYYEIFENNWSMEWGQISTFREILLETLNEESKDCLEMNTGNKELFDKRLEESSTRVKAHYCKIMFGIIERSYTDTATLEKAHNDTSERLLGNLKSELNEVAIDIINRVLDETRRAIGIFYDDVKKRNTKNKKDSPYSDFTKVTMLLGILLSNTHQVYAGINQFSAVIKTLKKIYNTGKEVIRFSASILPSSEAIVAALPSATTLAVAAVVVIGVSMVAYGVYRYYNTKQKNNKCINRD